MKRLLLSAVAVSLVLAVVGILTSHPGDTSTSVTGGTFRAYLTSDPGNLDPARGVDVNESSVQAKIYSGLVRYDENMKLVGDLAESWEAQSDGLAFVFKLRPGVKFHNGQAFSSADVVYSFERLLDPTTKSPRTWVLEKVVGAKERLQGLASSVAGISAPDPMTVKITLTEPFAPFLSLLSMPSCYILPFGSASDIDAKRFFEKPAGTGPYQMVGRERDSYVRLAAFPEYFGQKPQVGVLELRIIPESLKAEMEFESGNLDLLQLHPSNYARFAGRSEFDGRIHDVPAMSVFYVGFNNLKPPFDDVRVRRALNMMIDRGAIIKAVLQGRGVPARGSIPPGISGWSEALPGYTYDPKTALALLEEAGYTRKKPLTFDLFQKSSQAAFEITRLLQGELKKHGVVVNLRPMEWSALKDAIDKGEAPSFYLSWFGDYPDGENFLTPLFHSKNWGSGGNRARYKNENVDAMLTSAMRIQDPEKRAAAYAEINRIIVDEAPWLYLWYANESYVLGPQVEKMTFSPLFSVDKGLTMKLCR
ncbi:MAG TPA: ABC transporter substrate-binding protein [Candidatus Ozemobacteraceae bacterium]|nr:ABC transporter substrate-binding protein [Candidatus Ozemobacteraceae bacterium]